MQLTLKPLSPPGLDEIAVRERLFPIGRHEPPFNACQHEAMARLSRRHARIFMQDEAVYVVDLDSMNGTTVNGVALGKEPTQLHHNDELCFAGQLEFKVSLEGDSATHSERTSKFILTLLPERLQSVVDPGVVTEFPFLVSKSDDLFKRYKSRLPEQYKFLSRRHAHFFVRDDQLMLEDLGSTNGTFLSDRRLDEHAVVLHDGDTVAFGGNDFYYRVHVKVLEPKDQERLDKSELLTEALNTSNDLTRTTFVTSASSFIDIFCARGEQDEEEDEEERAEASSPGSLNAEERKARDKAPSRASIVLGELRRAFSSDDKPGNHRGWWMALAVLALVAALIGFSYYQEADIRSIEERLAAGDYVETVIEADRYLQSHPDQPDVSELALEALSRYVVPTWRQKMGAGSFANAYQTLERNRQLLTNSPIAEPFFGMLTWMTTLDEYVAERGGIGAPISLFRDEEKITHLIDAWDERSADYQKAASRITQYVPQFEIDHARALSLLRTLQSEKSLYIAAIEDLNRLLAQLPDDRYEEMEAAIEEFTGKYPRITGVDRLRRDLENYGELKRLIDRHAWLEAIGLLEKTRYATPPFLSKVEKLRTQSLPPVDVALQYQQATDAWMSGNGDSSLSMLDELSQGEWGHLARQVRQHRENGWGEFQQFAHAARDDAYSARLLTFYESLDPEEDVYFVKTMATEYRKHQSEAIDKAEQAFAGALKSWSAYQQAGRISGVQRLEATISDRYRLQAERLAASFREVTRGVEIYRLLEQEMSAGYNDLYEEILRECRLQRRSMQELEMVLESTLYARKIALLPDID